MPFWIRPVVCAVEYASLTEPNPNISEVLKPLEHKTSDNLLMVIFFLLQSMKFYFS